MSASAPYHGAVVVIPTRNRADLAMNAIRSALDQAFNEVQVLVSDNSTSEQSRDSLAGFCQKLGDKRLRYIVPPVPVSMTEHWDWALHQALASYDASHFIYLTDRMMFRPGSLKIITDIARLYPDRIISYNHDRIIDYPTPIRVEQYPGTGKAFEIKCLRLSYIYSQCHTHYALPRMLNCIAPRSALEAVRGRFGSFFASICPDFNFGFRCLEVFDSIILYDKSLIFHYALERSNGASVTRGELTPDSADFAANLPVDNSMRNYATPIPQLLSCGNAIMNEYCIIKQQTQSPRFFAVDEKRYLERMAEELNQMIDPQARADTEALLTAHGWTGNSGNTERPKTHLTDVPDRLLSRIKWKLKGASTKPFWLFLDRHFAVKPPSDNRFQFATVEEAIRFMNDFPRDSWQRWDGQEDLLPARELPAL